MPYKPWGCHSQGKKIPQSLQYDAKVRQEFCGSLGGVPHSAPQISSSSSQELNRLQTHQLYELRNAYGWMGGWVDGCTYRGAEQTAWKNPAGIPSWEDELKLKKKSQMVKILFHFPQAKENPTLCNKLVNSCWHFLPSASHYDMISPEKL